MQSEPISPELALVDPELAARARAALPDPAPPSWPARPTQSAPPSVAPRHGRPYPAWARVTAALWLLVLGILIGGAAIPHAQDTPRVIPKAEDAAIDFCEAPAPEPATPARPRAPLGQP